MNTKLKGDIAEQAAVLEALKRGWGVLKPLGDRLPYDLVFDVEGKLVRIQVKHGWADRQTGNYVADTRRTKTNRREMIRALYEATDFEFALVHVEDAGVFYVFPIEVFISYGSGIQLVETARRQRKPRSADYRDAWNLISQWAAREETPVRTPVKFGEAAGGVIPSQAPEVSEKV
jgi:hypothetical protein